MSVRTGVHARRVLGLLAIASLLFAPSGATTVDAQQPPDPQPEAETVPPPPDGEPAPPTSVPVDDQSGTPTSDVPTDVGAPEVPTSDVPTSVDEVTDPGPTLDEAPSGDVVDAEPIGGEGLPPPDIAAADDGDQLVVAQLIPNPGPGQAVVSVKVGGDRTGVAGVTPLSGVTLQLYAGGQNGPTVPVNQPWATCISDVDGDCNFLIPDTQPSGANRNQQFWVVEQAVPAGWYSNPQLLVGTTNSNGVVVYAFRTPGVQAGQTYLSTVNFMVSTGGDNNVASGGIWQNSRVNPTLPAECGLDVALIVDVSGSVSGSLAQLQTAATTLTNSLVGTPSRLSLFTFASVAPANTTNNANLDTLQPISTQAGADVVNTRINGLTAGGGTNWDRGLAQVAASPNSFDVALFITDGSPTYYGTQPEGPGNRTRFRETENGIFSANAIKVENTRVIAFGVGAGVGSAGAGLNLRAVSGTTLNSDYFQTTDYTQAGDLLRAAALQSCAGAVTVIKQVIPPGGTIVDAVPDGGWEFAATSPTAAVIPPTGTTASGTGAVSFDVDFPVGQASAQVEFTETQQAGYSVVPNSDGNNATCIRLDTGGLAPGYGNGPTPEQFQVSASANFPVSCTVYNLEPNPPATLTVDKSWDIISNGVSTIYQQGQQPAGIDAQLLVDANGEGWGTTLTGLTAGETVELDENILPLPTGCVLTGTVVNDAVGTEVSTSVPFSPTLAAGTNEFEITNTIECLTQLTLLKSVANGSALATDWTLEARLPVNPPPGSIDGPNGQTGVTAPVTPSVTYDLVETGDPNYVQFVAENAVINPPRTGSWSCVEVDENGVVIPGYSDGLNGGVTVPLGLFVQCTAVNRTAELTLIKNVDSPYGGTAAPDDWDLTATPVAPPAGVAAQTVTGSELGETINVRPGLTYDLTETDVAGYELDAIECVTNPDELTPPDTWAWVEVPSQSIDIAALSFDSDLEHTFCRFNNVETPPPYQILVTPAAATNRLTDDHEYQIELRTDSNRDGAVDDPVVGVDVALTWTGPAGSGIELVNGVAPPGAPTSVATCTTLPPISPFIGGACIVQVNSPIDVGSGVLTASFDIPFGTAGEPDLPTPDPGTTCTNPTIVGGVITQCNAVQLVQRIEASGNKTWVGYLVDVEADATNPVGIEHTFTIDVQRTDGTTSTPAGGVTVNFTWTGPAGSSVTDVNGVPAPGAVDCITDADGQCTVTVESTDFGAGTLAVTSVNGDLVGAGPRTETPTPGSDLTATKTWVDWRAIMTPPTATNAVDQDHVFTVALERNDGSGWVAEDAGKEIFVTWTGPAGSAITAVSAGAVTDPSSAVCLTDASGECTVTVSSPTNGQGTLTAFEAAVSIPGYTPPGGTPGSVFDFDIDDVSATKTWVVIRGTVSPPAATNLVGDPHEFTVLIETNGDAGWVPAPAGTTVTFSWVGAGGVTAVDAPGPDATSCTLRADGTCAVTVDSVSSGAGTFSIGDVTSLIVDGTQLVPAGGSLPVEDADASPADDSRVGTKQWIEFQGDAQTTATNLAGDEHVFTLTGTYDNGGGETALPDGSTITFTWTGDGQVTETDGNPDLDATSCNTTGGSCTVTVSSATSGSGTIEIESIAADIDGTQLTGVSTTTPPSLVATAGGSLTATKTWLELTADVAPSATNLAGDDHTFTLTASYDDGSGPVAVPDGSTIDYTWTGTTPANPAASCLTTAGACTVTVSSATAGSGTITIDSVTTTVGGSTFTDVVPAAATGGSLTATKTWIELFADVAATATNLAGEDHVFTITATYDDGTGVVAVPDGSTVAYTWTGATPADPASSCVIGTGTCEVTVSSTDPGSGTITIDSVTTTIGGETFTDVVPAAAAGGSLSATKTWVVFAAQVSPSATNLAGDDHVFTVSATVDDGSGPVAVPDGSTIEYLWAGAGTALPPTACATTGGSCLVTVSSGVAGTGTLTITAVSANIGGDLLLDTNVAAIAGGSLTATKTWIELFADVQATATNLAGDDHVFTITATYDDGAGSVAVPDGSTVAFTWTGATPADPASSCVIAAGSCDVTVSSAVAGSGTLTVDSVTATINGAAFTDVVPAAATGGSLTATKTWVELFADVQATATNLAGDDHVFTITATYDDGSGVVAVLDGSTVAYTWTGATPADPLSSCVIGAGTCEVTVSSTDPGSGTITIDSVTTTIGGETFTDVVPAAVAGGSLTATKTWVELFADVGVTATNVVGDDHVFTVTASYDDGSGVVAVPDGSTVSYSWSGATPAVPAGSCTIAAGSCDVTVSSPDPGSGTITVETVTATINGTDFTDVVPAASLGGSLTATKTWIEFRTDVAVTATNLSGDDHVFTLTAVYDDGSGPQPADGASFAYTWTGTGIAAPPTPCAAAADANTCEVTVSSADPGTGTITIDSVTATVDGTTFTDVAAVATQGGAVTANKTWIAFDVDITPLTALNLVSQPHTFTISVQVDDGGGLVPLPIPPNSGTVDWTFDAPDGTTPSGTCTLEAGGTCTVVQNSNVAGTGTLTATSLTVNYDGVDYGPIDLTAAGSGQSQDLTVPPTATKGWAGYTLTLDPPTAVNLWPAEPDHVVTLTLATFPPASGLPVVGQDIDVTLTSSVATITGVSDGTFTPTTAVCTTDAAATCEVTVTSTGPGAATLSAVYEAMVGGVQVPVPGVDDAEKTWRTYRVRVTPTADENLLGSPHTFTVTVERSDNGSTWTPVQGAVPTLAVSSPGSISSQTCNAGTSAAGTCTAVVTSPSTGTATLTATYEGTIDGASADFEGDGDKTWIDYRVTVTPSTAENLVDTNHVLTVTVEIDRGSGFVPLVGAEPAVVATGVGQITGNTCTAGTTTNGTCRATIRSTQPGTTRVTASFEGAAAGGETDTFSDSGTKSWIDYRLTLDPKSATNNVGEPHTFVATLEVDDGTGFGPAAGETLGFSVSGVGSISSIQPAGPAGGACTTDAAGECRITVNSPTAGSLTITVTFRAQAGPTEQTFTFDAQKSWIGGGIPNTGADSRRLVQIAAGITLAGLLLLLAARRRRTRSADATA